jgi:hypothetical protein
MCVSELHPGQVKREKNRRQRILSPSPVPARDQYNKSVVQREEYYPPPASAVLLSEKRRRLNFVEMDGFGIVYLIENAQQFWLGTLWGTVYRRGPC